MSIIADVAYAAAEGKWKQIRNNQGMDLFTNSHFLIETVKKRFSLPVRIIPSLVNMQTSPTDGKKNHFNFPLTIDTPINGLYWEVPLERGRDFTSLSI